VTEKTSATCTATGKTKTYCSICGNVQSESSSGSATGHNFRQEVWYTASCISNGYYNNICNTCGHIEGVSESPLPHAPVDTVLQQGNCALPKIIQHTCGICGFSLGSNTVTDGDPNAHDWGETMCNNCGEPK